MKKAILFIFLALTVASCTNIELKEKNNTNTGNITTEVNNSVQEGNITEVIESNGVVKNTDTITVTYTGSLEDGTIFDASSKHPEQPLSFKVGEGIVIAGFDKGVVGMKSGETKTMKISASEAYGETNELLLKDADFEAIENGGLKKEDMKLGVNKIINEGTEIGEVEILRIEDGKYFARHPSPLAGKNLIFEVRIDKIVPFVEKTVVRAGDNISVSYTGSLKDGTIFDATSKHGGTPLEFTAGAGQMISGFDSGVIGMKLGETKTLDIKAIDAYGETGTHDLAGKDLIFEVKIETIK